MRTLARSFGHVARLGAVLGLPPLLLALLVPIDALNPPADPPITELLASRAETLRFHLSLMLAACWIVLMLLRWWRFAGLAALLTAWALVPAVAWPSTEREPLPDSPTLKVLSVNLGDDRASKELVLEEIRRSKADLVCLQEYTPGWRDYMAKQLQQSYPFRKERARSDNFGMAVLSAQAWTRMDTFELHTTGTPQMRLELEHGGGSVVVYALHLLPPGRAGYAEHRAEFADLARRLRAETRPTVLVGDFNFVDHGALGAALHDLGFLDTHGLAGGGRGATWPVHGPLRHVPGIRIDHIYVGRGLTARAAWLGQHNGSDHLPLGATIVRAKP